VADAIDSLIKAAIGLIKHVGTSPVVGFALIFLSIYLFDISKDVNASDPIYFWFSGLSVPVLFVYGLVAVSLHWFRSNPATRLLAVAAA
jgi:hypothetical protein